jgi:hypothetical protein
VLRRTCSRSACTHSGLLLVHALAYRYLVDNSSSNNTGGLLLLKSACRVSVSGTGESVKLNTPQLAPLGRVESARAAPDFSAGLTFSTLTLKLTLT